MSVTLKVHVEAVDGGEVWWAETGDIARLTVAAPAIGREPAGGTVEP